MKLYSCPYKGEMCFDYGECENCAWYKIVEKNKKYRKQNKELKQKNTEAAEREKALNIMIDNLREENTELHTRVKELEAKHEE